MKTIRLPKVNQGRKIYHKVNHSTQDIFNRTGRESIFTSHTYPIKTFKEIIVSRLWHYLLLYTLKKALPTPQNRVGSTASSPTFETVKVFRRIFFLKLKCSLHRDLFKLYKVLNRSSVFVWISIIVCTYTHRVTNQIKCAVSLQL